MDEFVRNCREDDLDHAKCGELIERVRDPFSTIDDVITSWFKEVSI